LYIKFILVVRDTVRHIPGVPLIYLHGNAPTLERPSALTESLTTRLSDGKTALSQHQKQIIAALREEIIGPTEKSATAAGRVSDPRPFIAYPDSRF